MVALNRLPNACVPEEIRLISAYMHETSPDIFYLERGNAWLLYLSGVLVSCGN